MAQRREEKRENKRNKDKKWVIRMKRKKKEWKKNEERGQKKWNEKDCCNNKDECAKSQEEGGREKIKVGKLDCPFTNLNSQTVGSVFF